MNIYPKDYLKNVTEITLEYLKDHNIKALLLDVDNTLIDYHKYLSEDIIAWAKGLKEQGIILHIVSNSNNQKKIKKVADTLEIDYIFFASKPLKRGFQKAKEKVAYPCEEIAVVGDQIFTDILGANRMGMYSILVDPITSKDIWATLLKRPLENYIKKKYLKNKYRRK